MEFDIGGERGVNVESLPTELREVCEMGGMDLMELSSSLSQSSPSYDNLGAPSLGVTITPMFHLGLTRYTQGGQTIMRYTRAAVDRECYYAIEDEINDINAATKLNNTFW